MKKKSKYKEDFFIFLKERQQYHFEFNLDHEQTNELMHIAKNMGWSLQDEVDNVRSKSLHVIKEKL